MAIFKDTTFGALFGNIQWLTIAIVFELRDLVHPVKSRAVDQSTIQFWSFLAKGHSTQG